MHLNASNVMPTYKIPARKQRRIVLAASAEAAYRVNASTCSKLLY